MRKILFCAAAVILSAAFAAHAEEIRYIETAIASGSLNGVPFTNAPVIITGTGNTSGVIDPTTGIYANVVSVEGMVFGVGMFTFTPPSRFFSNENTGGAGAAASGFDILVTSNPLLDTYNLESAIGPITGSSIFNSGHIFATSDGDFDLTSVDDSTFEAFVATPEPGSLLLLGTGVLGFAGLVKRRLS